ncbi:hypothetical protein ACJX0J_033355, partial [Zea mays]
SLCNPTGVVQFMIQLVPNATPLTNAALRIEDGAANNGDHSLAFPESWNDISEMVHYYLFSGIDLVISPFRIASLMSKNGTSIPQGVMFIIPFLIKGFLMVTHMGEHSGILQLLI